MQRYQPFGYVSNRRRARGQPRRAPRAATSACSGSTWRTTAVGAGRRPAAARAPDPAHPLIITQAEASDGSARGGRRGGAPYRAPVHDSERSRRTRRWAARHRAPAGAPDRLAEHPPTARGEHRPPVRGRPRRRSGARRRRRSSVARTATWRRGSPPSSTRPATASTRGSPRSAPVGYVGCWPVASPAGRRLRLGRRPPPVHRPTLPTTAGLLHAPGHAQALAAAVLRDRAIHDDDPPLAITGSVRSGAAGRRFGGDVRMRRAHQQGPRP